jgi:diaminopimelate epimerase
MNKDINRNMALINAYRMDGLGNNFLIIDRRLNSLELSKKKITDIANKKVYPFDQLITLEKTNGKLYPIKIFNPDGIEVSACGNGARCIAYLISQENKQKKVSIKTAERVLDAEIVGEKNVKINMGKAKFNWDEIPLSKEMNTECVDIDFIKNETYHSDDVHGFCVNIGNPHIIYFVSDCSKINIKELGPKIENYKIFPERVNVTFASVSADRENIKVNVWERGAGQTKACGTAACATAKAAWCQGLANANSNVHFKDGSLQIDCSTDNIFMTGPVSEVKKINIDI